MGFCYPVRPFILVSLPPVSSTHASRSGFHDYRLEGPVRLGCQTGASLTLEDRDPRYTWISWWLPQSSRRHSGLGDPQTEILFEVETLCFLHALVSGNCL